MNGKKNKVLIVLLIQALTANEVQAASTASAVASATIVEPISITDVGDLAFGTISPGSNNGTVTVTPSNRVSSSGDLSLVSSNRSSAKLEIKGQSNMAFTVIMPTSATISIAGNPDATPMTIDSFTSNISSGTIQNDGSSSLNVGGTLHVPSNQAPGTYTGTFSVTVSYQ
ncbi:MAG: DUF4402 domain-containing protein [Chlorobiaceae bacterium]|nr:DUF4402 domain-containing protein [Chlorobiaceae bacterium]